MTYSQNAPFRADVVGSYLRPAELKKARADFAAGKIDKAALKAVEDKAIIELVAKQKAAGLHVITDGEFRRGWWHLDCMWGFAGVEKVSMDKGYFFHDEETRAESARLTGKIAFDQNHPFIEHFKFIKSSSKTTLSSHARPFRPRHSCMRSCSARKTSLPCTSSTATPRRITTSLPMTPPRPSMV